METKIRFLLLLSCVRFCCKRAKYIEPQSSMPVFESTFELNISFENKSQIGVKVGSKTVIAMKEAETRPIDQTRGQETQKCVNIKYWARSTTTM